MLTFLKLFFYRGFFLLLKKFFLDDKIKVDDLLKRLPKNKIEKEIL